jgi:hypothetical protein
MIVLISIIPQYSLIPSSDPELVLKKRNVPFVIKNKTKQCFVCSPKRNDNEIFLSFGLLIVCFRQLRGDSTHPHILSLSCDTSKEDSISLSITLFFREEKRV